MLVSTHAFASKPWRQRANLGRNFVRCCKRYLLVVRSYLFAAAIESAPVQGRPPCGQYTVWQRIKAVF